MESIVPAHQGIPARERLIVPLDVPTFDEARALVERLGDAVHFYKLGLELLLAGGGFTGQYAGMVDWLVKRGKKVLADVKIFDIERTTTAAVRQLNGQGVHSVTVHGTTEVLAGAVAAGGGVKILAVTVLTSFNQKDLEDLGYPGGIDVKQVVRGRARRAVEMGCDGVIASGEEVSDLRQALGGGFLVVVPGIRDNREVPVAADEDQKRVATVEQAFASGADYIVVGRPIRKAADPAAAALQIQERIAALFGAAAVLPPAAAGSGSSGPAPGS
jgi:orotidine-5'-phosphate decarboxylase